jgi:hypothetical protein
MSVWRRRAIESFPELRRELNDPHEIPNVYSLWFELFPLWRDAHTNGNDEILDRIYGYADWCFRQRAEDLWNSTAVCFYEHVLDHGSWETVLPRLSDELIRDVWGLWEYFMSEADMTLLRKVLHKHGRPVPALGTGLVEPEEARPRTPVAARRSSGRRSSHRGTRPRRDQRP